MKYNIHPNFIHYYLEGNSLNIAVYLLFDPPEKGVAFNDPLWKQNLFWKSLGSLGPSVLEMIIT